MSRESSDDPVSLGHGTCRKETAKAVMLRLTEQGEDEVWIPKSVIHDDSEVYAEGHDGDVVVKRWWAEKEGLG